MAYISLDELKEILPDIFNAWVNDNDESWEWIFQEIEQKCHVGTKGKKMKRKKIIKDVKDLTDSTYNVHEPKIKRLEDQVNELTKMIGELRRYSTDNLSSRINELSNKVSNLSSSNVSMNTKINRMELDITATKSMAQTAKDRTQVDYSKYSGKYDGNIDYNKEKSDADVIQEIYNRMAGRGATREELDTFRNLIQKYDALEKKEIPVVKKMCNTCKYFSESMNSVTCERCNHNDKWKEKETCETCKHSENVGGCAFADSCKNHSDWEAKDNG